MESIFIYALLLSPALVYVAAFAGLLLEANTLTFTIAFLTEEGFFSLPIIFPITFVGAVAGNLLWYLVGRYFAGRLGAFTRIMWALAEPFDKLLLSRPLHTIFFTKFVYGLNCAMVMRAGALGMSFRKFLYIDAVACVFWILILWPLGYFSGAVLAARFLKYIEIALLIAVVAFLLLKHFVKTYIERELRDEAKGR
jgi:membrane protein DedA with SNARE-associated domain